MLPIKKNMDRKINRKREEAFHKIFTASNNVLIPPDLQEIIRSNITLAILGCGFGSEVARQAVQNGFYNFILADFDTVSINNLNRQFFTFKDARKKNYKVFALKRRLLNVNPYLRIKTYNEGVTYENLEEIVDNSSIIVDGIDPPSGLHVSLLLNSYTHRRKKYVIYPVELAHRGVVYVFGSEGKVDLKEFLKIEGEADTIIKNRRYEDNLVEIIYEQILQEADDEARKMAYDFLNGLLPRYPQGGSITAILAARTIRIILQIISKKYLKTEYLPKTPVKFAPEANVVEW
jgi:hypothetical protein